MHDGELGGRMVVTPWKKEFPAHARYPLAVSPVKIKLGVRYVLPFHCARQLSGEYEPGSPEGFTPSLVFRL